MEVGVDKDIHLFILAYHKYLLSVYIFMPGSVLNSEDENNEQYRLKEKDFYLDSRMSRK